MNHLRPRALLLCLLWLSLGLTSLLSSGLQAVAQEQTPAAQSSSLQNGAVSGQTTPGSPIFSKEQPLQWRRVLTPASTLTQWLGKNEKYLGIEKAEFEQLLERAGVATTTEAPKSTWVAKAIYRASLNDDTLTGQAQFDIRHRGDQPTLFPLSPSSLAIWNAHWADAANGLTPLVANTRNAALLQVQKSDTLHFDWSLRANRDANGALLFPLSLPSAMANHFELELPQDYTPLVEAGVILSEPEDLPTARRWTLILGSQQSTTLRIVRQSSDTPAHSNDAVRQSTRYEFRTDAVEVTSQLRVDVLHQPLHKITLSLDPRLQLAYATLGETRLPWNETLSENGWKLIELSLPEPLLGNGRLIQLTAIAPFEPGKRWSLPQIRCRSLDWQEGIAALLVPSPLILRELTTRDCRQTHADPLLTPAAGTRVEVQYFTPDAQIEVDIAPAEPRVLVDLGTTVQLGSKDATAVSTAILTAVQGQQFLISGEVARNWFIESVDTSADNRIVEWNLTPRGNRSLLSVRLEKSIRPEQRVPLIITGRRRGVASNERLSLNDLRLIHFPQLQTRRDLLVVEGIGQHRLEQISPAAIRQIDIQQLSPEERGLFPAQISGMLYDLSSSSNLQFAITPQTPRYIANVEAHVSVTPDSLIESFQIHCQPDSTSLDKILVHFSQSSDVPFTWQSSPNSIGLNAVRLGTSADPAGQGETWEISLQTPQSNSFDLSAQRTVPLNTNQQTLSLAIVTQAASQSGTLTIEAAEGVRPSISSRLRAIALPPPPVREYSSVLAKFSYPAGIDALNSSESSVVVRLDAQESSEPTAWVWQCQQLAQIFADGSVSNQAVYELENIGQNELEFTLPSNSRLIAVLIDGRTAQANSLPNPDGSKYVVRLPAGNRFPKLTLRYFRQAEPLRWHARFDLPQPELNVPVLTRELKISLAPDYQILNRPGSNAALNTLSGWRQRLFGEFGRTDEAALFNPLQERAWQALWRKARDTHHLSPQASRYLTSLAKLLQPNSDGRSFTIAEALSQATADPEPLIETDEYLTLLIDQSALELLGIQRSLIVTNLSEGVTAEAGAAFLDRHGLAFIDAGKVALLTSRVRALLVDPVIHESEFDGVFCLGANSTRAVISRESWLNNRSYTNVIIWMTAPAVPGPPWGVHHEDGVTPHNWKTIHFETPTNGDVSVEIIRQSVQQSVSWCIFLATLGFTWCFVRGSALLRIVVFTSVGLIALFIPVYLIPITSKVFLGVLVGFACQLIPDQLLFKRPPFFTSKSASTKQVATTASSAVLLLLVLFGWSTYSPVQTSLAADTSVNNSSNTIYQVVIPVTAAGEPEGSIYYLPEGFYQELYRRSLSNEITHDTPLIHSAHYTTRLTRRTPSAAANLVEVLATYDIQTFTEASTLELNLGGKDAVFAADAVQLDGLSTPFQWNSGSQRLSVPDIEPGQHRIQVAFSIDMLASARFHELELSVPAVASATMRADLPMTSHFTASNILGGISTSPDRSAANLNTPIDIRLGPTSRVVLRWANPATQVSAEPVFDVEELIWMRIRPGGVVFDTRFKITVIEGLLHQVQVSADSRLRPLPVPATSAVSAIRTTTGEAIALELARPVTDQAVLDASFVLPGASGVGHLRIPKLQLIGARNQSRSLAVSVDPALQQSFETKLATIPTDTFLKAWGTVTTAGPQAAFELTGPTASSWVVATRPRSTMIAEAQRLSLTVTDDRIETALAVRLSVTGGHRFQYYLKVPESFHLENVLLRQDGSDRAVTWSQQGDQTAIIRLDEPSADPQILLVQGHIKRGSGSIPLPRFQIEQSTISSSRTSIYRLPSMLVDVQDAQPVDLTAEDPILLINDPKITAFLASPPRKQGVQIAEIDSLANQPATKLEIRPNRPQTDARVVTEVERSASGWQATVHAQINVENGLVDTLVFDIPTYWSGPFELNQPATYEILQIPGRTRPQLIVRPVTAITGSYQLAIKAPLTVASGQTVRAPDVNLRGIHRKTRFLYLPTQLDNRQLAWDLQGRLQTSQRARQALAESQPTGPFVAFEVFSDQFQAALRSIETQGAEAKVHLASHSVRILPDHSLLGVTGFDIEPAGRTTFLIKLPEGSQLVSASQHGRAAIVHNLEGSRWTINLLQNQLPSRITIVYRQPSVQTSPTLQQRTIVAPEIESLPIDETVWEVRVATTTEPAVIDASSISLENNITQIDRGNYLLLQWESAIDLLAASDQLSIEQPTAQTLYWLRPWAQRCRMLRDTLIASLRAVQSEARREELQNEIAYLEQRQAQLFAMLDTGVARSEGRTDILTSAEELWNLTGDSEISLFGRSTPSEFTFTIAPSKINWAQKTLPAAFVLGFLSLLALVPYTQHTLRMLWLRSPQLLGVVVGLLWWILLTPSFIGLLFILLSLAATVRARSYLPKEPRSNSALKLESSTQSHLSKIS